LTRTVYRSSREGLVLTAFSPPLRLLIFSFSKEQQMGIRRTYTFLRKSNDYCGFFSDPKKPSFPPTQPFRGKKVVVIEDLLTRMHYIPGPRKDFQVTTEELLDHILYDVKIVLSKGWCQTYVLVVDVPCLKKDFYKLRHLQNRGEGDRECKNEDEPYPSHFDFYPGGIGDGKGKPELIHTKRLMAPSNDFLRERLWTAIGSLMSRVKFPEDTTVIFDYQPKGPLVVSNQFVLPAFPPFARDEEYEADFQIWLWALRYNDHPVWIRSTDSDCIIYGMIFLHELGPKRLAKVYWVDKWGQTFCRLTDLMLFVNTKEHMGTNAFAVATFLCGNDFLDHMWFTPRLDPETVFCTLQEITHMKNGWEVLHRMIDEPKALYAIVTRCYLYGKKDKHAPLPAHAPSWDEQFKHKHIMFRWMWGYAFRLWDTVEMIPCDYASFAQESRKRSLLVSEKAETLKNKYNRAKRGKWEAKEQEETVSSQETPIESNRTAPDASALDITDMDELPDDYFIFPTIGR
jgi:hypothetical protein